WETASTAVSRINALSSRRIIELLLRCICEYRLMRHLAVIQLRSREIQTFCRDYGRSVFNEQHRQTVRRDPVRFRHDNAVAVRVHHVSVNPTTARRAKLADVQFAR